MHAIPGRVRVISQTQPLSSQSVHFGGESLNNLSINALSGTLTTFRPLCFEVELLQRMHSSSVRPLPLGTGTRRFPQRKQRAAFSMRDSL
jgi:hypothetical protein